MATYTIAKIKLIPGHTHPALGNLYAVKDSNNNTHLVYTETFLHQVSSVFDLVDIDCFTGYNLDTNGAYWAFEIPEIPAGF